MTLDKIEKNVSVIITDIEESSHKYRLLEYGFTPNTEIMIVSKVLFGTIAVSLRGTIIALRDSIAKTIKIKLK